MYGVHAREIWKEAGKKGKEYGKMQKIGGNKRYGEGTGYTLLYSFSF